MDSKLLNLNRLLESTKEDLLRWNVTYEICKRYLEIKNVEEAENWNKKCSDLDKNRSENFYILCRHFREVGNIEKAYYYYLLGKDIPKPDKGLNIQHDVYEYLFEYESTIIWYYIFNDKLLEGLKKSIIFLNKETPFFDNVYHNLEYYIQPLVKKSLEFKEYEFKPEKGYYHSSCSLIPFADKFLMNIRYHNYYITKDGSYLSNELKDNQYIVRTKNSYTFLDYNFEQVSDEKKMPDVLDNLSVNNSRIKGLEDMRIFSFQNQVYYIGTSCEYYPYFRIILGKYDFETQRFSDSKILIPPTETNCEKNWVPLIWKDRINFIYNWYPLTIGKVEDDKLVIFHSQNTPKYFSKIRGSSNAFLYNNEYWCLTHSVKHTSPRKYWHQFVILDVDSLKVKRYSLPFTFVSMSIEYCLSVYIKDDIITFVFSEFDKTSALLQVQIDKLNFINL